LDQQAKKPTFFLRRQHPLRARIRRWRIKTVIWRIGPRRQKLLASDGTKDNHFGRSVSIDGEYAVVGALGDDSSRGSAYVFKRSGTSWIQEAKLTASDGAAGDRFGSSVSLSGGYTIIGAYYNTNAGGTGAGAAYVFKGPLPELAFGSIWAAMRVTVVIKNIGTAPVTGISGKIELTGGFILIGRETTRSRPDIPPGGQFNMQSNFIFGFGNTPIVITVTCTEGVTIQTTVKGFVFLFLVLGV
jgi:hypothetical protein